MKLVEIEMLVNDSLKSLSGVKVESFKEFNRLKSEALSEIAQQFNFSVESWTLQLELNDETVCKSFKDIFKVVRDTSNNRLFVFNEPSIINEVKVVLTRPMEKYANVDIENLNYVYSRDCLKTAIELQQNYLEKKLQKVKEEELILSNFKKEYKRIEQEFLELAVTI